MSNLSRFTAKVFGSAAGTDQISQFGSLLAGTPAFSTDPAVVQSLSNWLTGWFGGAIGGNSPAIEDMNAAMYVMSYQNAYLLQKGIAEWDSGTTYYQGDIVNAGGGVLYYSLTNTNLNNPVSDQTKWRRSGGTSLTSTRNSSFSMAPGDFTPLDVSAGDFNVTLPSAVGLGGVTVSLNIVGPSLQYGATLLTTGGQTIGGYASGVLKMQTFGENLVLMSNNLNWLIFAHRTSTPYQPFPMLITSTGSQPSKGATDFEVCVWRRNGCDMEIIWNMISTGVGAVSGTGEYLMGLPTYAQAAAAIVGPGNVTSTPMPVPIGGQFGAAIADGSARGFGTVNLYDATRLSANLYDYATINQYAQWGSNSGFTFDPGTPRQYSLKASVPIEGWFA